MSFLRNWNRRNRSTLQSVSTRNTNWLQELLRWKPTCHHNDKLLERAEKFLHVPGYEKMPLFYIWGHSFEFERENTWPLMEQLAEKLHGAQDIWYATNGQIADYLTALRSTRESADGKRL